MEGENYILNMQRISKSFSGIQVLNEVNLEVKSGEVHVLIGENGAGKSTLMKILIGMYSRDGGEIFYKGQPINLHSTREALDLGITMIHQELSPVLEMTVAENIFLGREFKNPVTRLVDQKKMQRETQKLFDQFGIDDISAATQMKSLSVAQIQMVEIIKAVSYNADLIIMDEPTSAITDNEVEKLFVMIRSLISKGVAIIYISHKLDEIYEIGDRITVLRDGEYIATKTVKELPRDELVRMMVGRELHDLFVKGDHRTDEVMLEVRGLSNGKLFQDINFKLHKGEILGLSGLVGAGRSEIVETIFGMRGKYEGEIFVKGKKVTVRSEEDAIKNGIALATEDRKSTGLFLGLPIRNNISMAWLKFLTKFGFVNTRSEKIKTAEMSEKLKVKASSDTVEVGTLSGGNQQKVVLAKWLLTDPDILILDEPTRGIDIGAKAEIYKIMEDLTRQGKSIIMVSSEMPEILGMSDRVVVIADGRNKGVLERPEISQVSIMNLITDVEKEEKKA